MSTKKTTVADKRRANKKKRTNNPASRLDSASWLTTDDEERAARRKRAETENLKVRRTSETSVPPFQDYEVSKPGEKTSTYLVEMRSLTRDVNSCSCPDFATNGLGTCKHIERVKRFLKRVPREFGVESPLAEIFVSGASDEVVVLTGAGASRRTLKILSPYLDGTRLIDDSPATLRAFVDLCRNEIAHGNAELRLSRTVFQRLDELERRARMETLRADFAQKLDAADGELPFLRQKLYPYQREGMMHLAFKGRALLADEMGLGKTVQAIAAAMLMRETVGIRKVLVVAPASLKSEWEEQIRLFTDASARVLFGNYAERMRVYKSDTAFFLITNYEQVLRDLAFINEAMRPDLVILDEAQRIKNWKTKTARKIKRINSPYAFVLTGTPLENRIDELYSLLDFIEPKLLGSVFRFNRRFYNFDERKRLTGLCNLAELQERAKTVMLRRRKADIDEQLPGITRKNYFVPLTPAQTADYEQAYLVVCRLINASERRPLTQKELDLLQKKLACMRMLCDTCYILDHETKVSPKVDELSLILNDIWLNEPTRKVIIFSEWTRMLDLVEEMLEDEGVGYAVHTGQVDQLRRRTEINKFKKDPDCKVFLSSEAGGVGLNLQAASVVVNLDLPWNPAKLEQRIARAWRKHQVHSVDVINIIAQHTIEEDMLDKLKYKQGLADFVLDAQGDNETFETANARKAFLAQLKEIINPDASSAAVPRQVVRPEPPPTEKLSQLIKEKSDDLLSCSVKLAPTDGTTTAGKIASVLAVSDDPHTRSAEACAAAMGVPAENVVTITPETRDLLHKLEALGFLTINRDADVNPIDTGVPSMPTDELLRRRRIKPLLATIDRQMKLASVLTANEFADEAARALHEAVVKALGVFHVLNGAKKDDDLEPITQRMLDDLSSNGTFPQYVIENLIQAFRQTTTNEDTLQTLAAARSYFASV